ncbi:hypothetical protein ACVW00_002745 [Marmoricola sp. URHA0025 HA25]
MSQQRPQGRRRAHEVADPAGIEPASFAELATMWRSVSHAHAVLDHLRQHFLDTDLDALLAEQLSLVPVLHDWKPVTETEARELSYLLGLYADPPLDATREEVAHTANVTIRWMAARRGSGDRSG